jgi:hypothetical protein
MSSLIIGIATFVLHAFVLKLAVGTMGAPQHKNTLSKALTVAFGLSVAGFLIGFVPLVSWPLYALLWVAVIATVYEIGIMRSIGVAVLQVVLKLVIWLLLKLVGLPLALTQML